MRIRMTGVPVTDQDAALAFYTEKLGFAVKEDVNMGGPDDRNARLLTLVSPEEPDAAVLLLEPCGEHPATKTYKAALYDQGIPHAAFEVDDIHAEYERLKGLGVEFKGEPADAGPSLMAILDDTCGSWIMIYQMK